MKRLFLSNELRSSFLLEGLAYWRSFPSTNFVGTVLHPVALYYDVSHFVVVLHIFISACANQIIVGQVDLRLVAADA